MPFGATVLGQETRFRLWAPAAQSVDLVLEADDETQAVPMRACGAGWFEAVEPALPGSLYRFRIDDHVLVPDPASRFQPRDVHGPSMVVDPHDYRWRENGWKGRAWEEAVIYELHVGTFSRSGGYGGVRERLQYLAELGATVLELMPIADFPGRRNWGYDGVLPFAPDSTYGTPGDLKALVDAAHGHGLMVLLDVVYNHFGPDGNFLHLFAPQFFTRDVETPWGAALDFGRREVREFFIHNALYWLEEFRFDGLRLDAVHAIADEQSPDILEELARSVGEHFGDDRYVHLVLENDDNAARYLDRNTAGRPLYYTAQWNDDIHHAMHVIATGERAGYYEDYADHPVDFLGRCLTEGFAYQGEPSRHRDGKPRGEPSMHLPATAFVSFLQNHDQVGNRAFGDRLAGLARREPLEALIAVMLLAPSPPLLFMGEEWGSLEPFPFFCDFSDELADSVREGRRREFARFPEFRHSEARAKIPDPNAQETFDSAVLRWQRAQRAGHAERLALYRTLLRLRNEEIVPRLNGLPASAANYSLFGDGAILAAWKLGDGSALTLVANLADEPCAGPRQRPGHVLYANHLDVTGTLPAWYVAWRLDGFEHRIR